MKELKTMPFINQEDIGVSNTWLAKPWTTRGCGGACWVPVGTSHTSALPLPPIRNPVQAFSDLGSAQTETFQRSVRSPAFSASTRSL